jgi:uncharacterized protein YaaQ
MDDQAQTTTATGKMRLLFAVVQSQDVENAVSHLNQLGFSTIRLPSTGGFLGRRNATLLIGTPIGEEEKAIASLRQNCRQRVEYIAVPIESAPLPLPSPTPVTVGGAILFALDVDHFEEF